MAVMDCNSTNGTYCSRANQPLRKLQPNTNWVLKVCSVRFSKSAAETNLW